VLLGGDRRVRLSEPSELAPSREVGGIGGSDEHAAERRDERLSPEGPFVGGRHDVLLGLVEIESM
jgi:hypothetical protein